MRKKRRTKPTMCYKVKQKATKPELEKRFNAKSEDPIYPRDELFAFDNALVPIITNEEPDRIQLFSWGLIPPAHRKPEDIRKITKNARYDELLDKVSYRPVVHQKCLITVTGFYEWHHLPGGGKQQYLLTLNKEALFSIGGLWSIHTNPFDGTETKTFTMLTTEAQGIMAQVHNDGLRQPLMLKKEVEKKWLNTPYDPEEFFPVLNLNAKKVGKTPNPNLFGDLFD